MTGYGMISAGAPLAALGYVMRVVAERQRFNRRLFGGLFANYREYYCNHILTEGGALLFALGIVSVFAGLLQLEGGR